jgi:hypothetical protein
MTDTPSFLAAELTELGLMAAADPGFAERLLAALQRLPAEGASETALRTRSENASRTAA